MKPRWTDLLKQRIGSFAALAETLDVDKATVSRWATKRIPAERVLDVERATGISRHDLRPDLYPKSGAAQ